MIERIKSKLDKIDYTTVDKIYRTSFILLLATVCLAIVFIFGMEYGMGTNDFYCSQSPIASRPFHIPFQCQDNQCTLNFDNQVYMSIALGNSMLPIIPNNTGVIFKVVDDPSQLEMGDIVVYRSSDKPILHRIVGTCDGGFVTKGDNSGVVDDCINYTDIIGEVAVILYEPK